MSKFLKARFESMKRGTAVTRADTNAVVDLFGKDLPVRFKKDNMMYEIIKTDTDEIQIIRYVSYE